MMAQSGHEWAAVCLFYSAHHLVKRALLLDPVFNDPTAMTALGITRQAQHPASHTGHTRSDGGRLFGVNDLVLKLYKPIDAPYQRLSQASHQVRYQNGFRGGVKGLQKLEQDLASIENLSAANALQGPMAAPVTGGR
ncbi:hypothetical protein [Kineococcus sp. R86509]|uniref:hypothetical protein n=1 Tax=Kineococcus sp. R86509 TaxID=3093851 RepID=UPI0036D2133A